MTEHRMYEPAPYQFTDAEHKELSMALARANMEVNELEEHKAGVTADLNAQIKNAKIRVNELMQRVATGEEMRPTEVLVLMDTPRMGMKSVIRVDTGKELRQEPMTAEEQQGSFAVPEEEPPKE